MAHRARGRAVPVPGFGAQAVLRAVNERTRLVALCNPNDPTGELVAVDELRSLLEALPERVVVLLDEALRDFVDAEERDAALALVEDFPRLLVFRTFSKAWGLAGLRVGYAVGGPGAEPLLEQLEPELGLNELAQAGALEALRHAGGVVAGRAAMVAAERARLSDAVRAARAARRAQPGQRAVAARGAVDGGELARRLERHGVIVAPGGPLGDDACVRAVDPAPRGRRPPPAVAGAQRRNAEPRGSCRGRARSCRAAARPRGRCRAGAR